MMYLMGALARKYRLPWRTSGFHVGSKLNDAQAGYEANMLMHAAILSGANYIWHVAGWLEAGLCCGYSKFVTDAEQLVGWYKYAGGLPFDDFKEAMAAVREVGPAGISSARSTRWNTSRRPSSFPASWISIPSSNGRRRAQRITTRGAATRPVPCWRPMKSRSLMKALPKDCATSSRSAKRNCRIASADGAVLGWRHAGRLHHLCHCDAARRCRSGLHERPIPRHHQWHGQGAAQGSSAAGLDHRLLYPARGRPRRREAAGPAGHLLVGLPHRRRTSLLSAAAEMVFDRRGQRLQATAEQAITVDHVRNIAAFPLAIPLMAGRAPSRR